MTIKTTTLSKTDLGFCTEVNVSYCCPHCYESVSDIVNLSNDGLGSSVVLSDCECPNCGHYVDLDIDL